MPPYPAAREAPGSRFPISRFLYPRLFILFLQPLIRSLGMAPSKRSSRLTAAARSFLRDFTIFILPPKHQIVKHFFEDFLKFLGELIDLRTFPVAFSEVFVSDVRLTVIYFSTDPLKKQVLFSLFLNYFAVRLFAQFFLSDLAALSIIRPTACPASPLISCAPAGRSAPASYAAALQCRSGSFLHRNEAG